MMKSYWFTRRLRVAAIAATCEMSSLSNKTIYNFLEIEQQNSCKTFFVISLFTVYDIEIIIEVL